MSFLTKLWKGFSQHLRRHRRIQVWHEDIGILLCPTNANGSISQRYDNNEKG